MFRLRDRQQGKNEEQQQGAVSGRSTTDIHMNGAVRGAVEVLNFCMNSRENDALAAERIRTFNAPHVDAQQWLHRSSKLQHAVEMRADFFVVPRRAPNRRSRGSKAPQFDIRGPFAGIFASH